MARTAITVTDIDADTFENMAAASVYETLDSVNGAYIASGSRGGGLFLHFKNTNAAARDVTIKAGDGGDVGPGWRSDLGDLLIEVALTSGEQGIMLRDYARFTQSDGTINIDCEGVGVEVACLRMPK